MNNGIMHWNREHTGRQGLQWGRGSGNMGSDMSGNLSSHTSNFNLQAWKRDVLLNYTFGTIRQLTEKAFNSV